MPLFSASSIAPRVEGRNDVWEPFSLSFFKLFQDSFVRQTWTWWLGGLGFPFLFWALGSVDGFWAIFIHVLSTVDQWICWALDPWWITEILNLIHGGPKKWASTFSPPSPCLTWCEVRVSSVTQSADHKALISLCIRGPLLLLSLRLLN